jgi:hypothetical protein
MRGDGDRPITSGFQVGGSLASDAVSYVRRQADEQLYAAVTQGEFCYVFNARQMGKSSLRVQVMRRLVQAGWRCVAIDLSAIGTQQITPGQWYASLAAMLLSQVQLPLRLGDWWRDRAELSDVARLGQLLELILAEPTAPALVIFLDEVDSLLGLPFGMDDFFGWIRSCYNRRAEDERYQRLTFVLLGVTTPPALMRDKRLTPFNIGQAIGLRGFQPIEALPLLGMLQQRWDEAAAVILPQILYWTGGQPFLTQKLCQLVMQLPPPIAATEWPQVLRQLVQRSVIDHWEGQDEPEHLRTIRDRLLHDQAQAPARLRYYQRILQSPQGRWPIDNSEIQRELQLSGLVQLQQDCLQVANPIYEAVFNADWVDQQLARLGAVALTPEVTVALTLEGAGARPVSVAPAPPMVTARSQPTSFDRRWRGGGLLVGAMLALVAGWQYEAARSRHQQLIQADVVAAQALAELAELGSRPPAGALTWQQSLFHAYRADRASQALGQPNVTAAQLLQTLVYRYQPDQTRYQTWQSPSPLLQAGFQGKNQQVWWLGQDGTIGPPTLGVQLPPSLRQLGVRQAVWLSQPEQLMVLDRRQQLWCLPLAESGQSIRLGAPRRCTPAPIAAQPVVELLSSDDGSTVAVILANGAAQIWQVMAAGLRRRGELAQVRQLEFLPQRSEFLVLTRQGQIQHYYADLALAGQFEPGVSLQAIAPSHNGELVVGVSDAAQLRLWSTSGEAIAQFPLPFQGLEQNPVIQLQLNADSSLIALGRRHGPIWLIDRQGQGRGALPIGGPHFGRLRFDGSSNQLLSRSGSEVTVWQLAQLTAAPWRPQVCPLLRSYLATAPDLTAADRALCR